MGNIKSIAFNDKFEHDNIETFMVVWIDAEINKKIENQKAQEQIRAVNKNFKVFENGKQCEKFIRSISSKKEILLIINDIQGQELIPKIHNLQQITTIYIYKEIKQDNEQWINQFSKIKAVVRQLDELILTIKVDQKNIPLVKKIDQQSVDFTPQFVYSQLLSNILLQSKSNKTDRHNLISLCKDLCKDSESDLKILDEFEQTYSSEKALWWYTRLTCCDKILNQALRTYDINRIFLFQFFIHDINQKITECRYHYPVTVYRGQFMIENEIHSLVASIGSIISVNTFFPTVLDRNRAFDALNTCNNSNDMHPVFFEIDADPEVVTTKTFANITKHSEFPNQRKVLFTIGSLFRITSIKNDDGDDAGDNNRKIWIIRMTLCGDNDPDVKPLFDEMKSKYTWHNEQMTLISLSRILCELKKYNEAENCCDRLRYDFCLNNCLLSVLYDELAEIAASQGDYDFSDRWHQKSHKIQSNSTETLNNKCLSSNLLPTINTDNQNSKNHQRFMDLATENHQVLLPIEGHGKMPLVTLEEAVVPLVYILPDISRKAYTAKENCKNPADGLTPDQSAAIMLYTMEWEPKHQCLYYALNTQLRTADRKALKPWFLYLKLILTALSRLPSIERTVYRGVKLNLSSKHPEGEKFFWWGFSSCTTTMNVLKSDQYLGTNGIRTLFHIECKNGKDIRNHSYYQTEHEILLLPATYLEVMSCFEMAPNLHVIQLKEIQSKYPYLEPVS